MQEKNVMLLGTHKEPCLASRPPWITSASFMKESQGVNVDLSNETTDNEPSIADRHAATVRVSFNISRTNSTEL